MTPTKGQDLLVEALADVADLAWTCLLVGPLVRDPGHVAAVRALLARHGLAGRVRLTGPRTGPDLDAAYAAADLLVVPSRRESYGMVVTEALARGIPVLAAAVDGVPDTLGCAADGRVPGLLVPPGDVAALTVALRRWLGDPDLRETTRSAARERRADLDGWEVTARCLTQVLAGTAQRWDARLSEPGSPECTPDWLALREPADAAARAARAGGPAAPAPAAGPAGRARPGLRFGLDGPLARRAAAGRAALGAARPRPRPAGRSPRRACPLASRPRPRPVTSPTSTPPPSPGPRW